MYLLMIYQTLFIQYILEFQLCDGHLFNYEGLSSCWKLYISAYRCICNILLWCSISSVLSRGTDTCVLTSSTIQNYMQLLIDLLIQIKLVIAVSPFVFKKIQNWSFNSMCALKGVVWNKMIRIFSMKQSIPAVLFISLYSSKTSHLTSVSSASKSQLATHKTKAHTTGTHFIRKKVKRK